MMLLLLLLLLGSSACCWALIVMLMMMIYGRSLFVEGFRSRVVGADDLEEVNGLAGLVFFSLFREEKIIRLSAPTKHLK